MMCNTAEVTMRGQLIYDLPMAEHTTWRVGGRADRAYLPADIVDLSLFLASEAALQPIYMVGLGSNLLVRDSGIRGTVVMTPGLLGGCERLGDHLVRVEAGVTCAKVARQCARWGLSGAGFLSGIPGTMGGALAMNAGCFGGETWGLVQQLETIDGYGVLRRRAATDYQVGYRSVTGPEGEWFVAATLALEWGSCHVLMDENRLLLERRRSSQPTTLPNAGSVFRNPEGDHAARLIEVTGLKGLCYGDACVSTKHANFIVNQGQATATEIEALMHHIIAEVELHHGVLLRPEVRIVGEPLEATHE